MAFDVFKLDNPKGKLKYNQLLAAFGIKLPHYLLDYYEIFCSGFSNLIVFSYSNDDSNEKIFMPGYYKPINIFNEKTSYFDFSTPYGYTGPVFSEKITIECIRNFWDLVDKWHREHKVVSEFIRFNLSDNHLFYSGDVFSTLLNIKGRIINEIEQWKAFEHKVRKNVKRAQKENISVKLFYQNIGETQIMEFYEIYIETMMRTNASKAFFFKFSDFYKFVNNNKNTSAIGTIYFNEKAISSELVLVSEDTIYSFLGGTIAEYFNKRPNDLLKYELISWARTQGFKYFVLGGGYGEEDGIFKYKKSFFPNDVVNFITGRKIINKEIYDKLIVKCNNHRKDLDLSLLEISDTSFFPLYRKQT
ncbi:MAG: GNAT family N-acetyltransferase [Candidatus Delongbacteria bacterium]|nr:GNAT family N-acetyltransferase [Candidatus Delongbacteria bacterium]